MKKLVIAEKPSVGRDIARVLGCKQQGKKYIEGKLWFRVAPVNKMGFVKH